MSAVMNIEQVCQELISKGVEFEGLPVKQPWGGVLAHFRDPDGNVITLLGGASA
jgi:lactoylglutathione lyase